MSTSTFDASFTGPGGISQSLFAHDSVNIFDRKKYSISRDQYAFDVGIDNYRITISFHLPAGIGNGRTDHSVLS
jgi:hypothetical protein